MDNNLIKIKKINLNNLEELKNFFNFYCGNSIDYFTYFKKRNFNIITNHLVTNLAYYENIPCAYSHLDLEKENVWLGICVGENFKKKGIGKNLLNYTLNQAKEYKINNVLLSVYKNNIAAINLYNKFNFKIYKENKENFFMIKDI